jgi:hypothetical protein
MMMILPALMLLAAMGSGTEPELPGVIRAVVSIVRADAVSSFSTSQPQSLRGPVLLDVQSAIDAYESIVKDLHPGDVMRDVDITVRDVRHDEAVRCEPWGHRPGAKRCWVDGDGQIVWFDSIARSDSGYTVVVSYSVSDRRPSGNSALTLKKMRLRLVRTTSGWVERAREIISIS